MSAERQLEIIDQERDPVTTAASVLTPMAMIDRALASGAGLDLVTKLMDLQERWEANNARKAFNQAFAAFKAEAVVVVRNRKVTDGPLKNKSYAELVSFVDAATPALSKHGLSHSWDITRDEKDWIEVTCVIEHELGGTKKVPFGGPPDTGPGRNAMQARVSTLTYLERATFKAATGLAEQGDDDDGRGGARTKDATAVNPEQVKELLALIEQTGTEIDQFCRAFTIDAIPDMRAADFERAKSMLNRKASRK